MKPTNYHLFDFLISIQSYQGMSHFGKPVNRQPFMKGTGISVSRFPFRNSCQPMIWLRIRLSPEKNIR